MLRSVPSARLITVPMSEGSWAEPVSAASMPLVKPLDQPGGEQDDNGRADKEPGPLLERLPAEA
jgi:hypothetical protein